MYTPVHLHIYSRCCTSVHAYRHGCTLRSAATQTLATKTQSVYVLQLPTSTVLCAQGL
jgi:hypothetical protein